MGKKRQAFQQKLRTREHVIAELAVNHVERQVLLCGHSVERIIHDYGLDLILFTYNPTGEVEEGPIYLQVKATERASLLRDHQTVAFRVSRADVQTWLRHSMPVILVVYDVSVETAYRLYVQRHLAPRTGFTLAKAANTVTLRVPVQQTLTPAAVRQFAEYRDRVLGQFGVVDHG